MHVVCGKRVSEFTVAAMLNSRPLLAVTDTLSKREFLVDTGAEVSIIPATNSDKAASWSQHNKKLRAANGTGISTYGHADLTVCIHGKTFQHRFIIADVHRALMGADFLLKHKLLVDLPKQRLIHSDSLSPLIGIIRDSDGIALGVSFETSDIYRRLLRRFPQVTEADFSKHAPKHNVEHRIVTEAPPVWSKPRRLNVDKLKAAKAEFDHLLRLGIIQPSTSQWSSPLHMVRKSNNEWRPCGDYRRLNAITAPDRYPVPHVQDFASQLNGASVFSKIDLIRGYHQIPVAKEDQPKTAVTTPFGLFEFLRMPFGLRNAGQTFQRAMHAVLRDLPRVFVYIDDILVASRDRDEHIQDLTQVLERLQEHGLVVRPEKCVFGKEKLTFLGHEITRDGLQPLPERVDAINNYPTPTTAKQLQKFLGIINYYHRFLPNASAVMQPLHALSNTKPATKQLVWNAECTAAFQKIKELLSKATQLAFPEENAQLALSTDASDTGIGAVVEQRTKDGWQPLAFFSRALTDAQKKYSTFDRELLAAHAAARHFTYLLDGRACVLFTDHKPLIHSWKRQGDAWSARQQRHLSTLAESFIDVRHLDGKKNVVADALSRDSILGVYQAISPQRIHEEQAADAYTRDARTAITGLHLRDMMIDGFSILCDESLGYPRPLVPPSLRKEVFDILHDLAHPGTRVTKRLISRDYVWHHMSRDITVWCRQCQKCQRAKTHRHVKTPIPVIPVPDRAFSHVHVDIVGPLPHCKGFSYLLTVVDRHSRWPDAIPLHGITAEECADAFMLQWVARHGMPRDITSDRGRQFVSQLWQTMGQSLNARLHFTTAYHPQSNGIVERMHRTMKASLRAKLADDNWLCKLPWVLLGLRSAMKEDLNASPADMVYRHHLNLPGNVIDSSLPSSLPKHLPSVKHHGNSPSYIPKDLATCKSVWLRNDKVRRPLDTPYTGPYPVVRRCDKYLVIKVYGKEQSVSCDRVKPASTCDDDAECVHQRTRSGRVSKPPSRFS